MIRGNMFKALLIVLILSANILFAQNGKFRKNLEQQFQGNEIFNSLKERENEILMFLKDNLPKKYDKIIKLRDDKPKAYRMMMIKLNQRYSAFMIMRENNSDGYKLELERLKLEDDVEDAVTQIKKSESKSDKEEYKKQLRKLVEKEFDIKTQIVKNEIIFFERRLNESKEKIQGRDEKRDKIIDLRIDQLLDGNLEW
jgi:hypothetical protein